MASAEKGGIAVALFSQQTFEPSAVSPRPQPYNAARGFCQLRAPHALPRTCVAAPTFTPSMEQAIDGDFAAETGWAYHGRLDLATIVFSFDGVYNVSAARIVSGLAAGDHRITSFRLAYLRCSSGRSRDREEGAVAGAVRAAVAAAAAAGEGVESSVARLISDERWAAVSGVRADHAGSIRGDMPLGAKEECVAFDAVSTCALKVSVRAPIFTATGGGASPFLPSRGLAAAWTQVHGTDRSVLMFCTPPTALGAWGGHREPQRGAARVPGACCHGGRAQCRRRAPCQSGAGSGGAAGRSLGPGRKRGLPAPKIPGVSGAPRRGAELDAPPV